MNRTITSPAPDQVNDDFLTALEHAYNLTRKSQMEDAAQRERALAAQASVDPCHAAYMRANEPAILPELTREQMAVKAYRFGLRMMLNDLTAVHHHGLHHGMVHRDNAVDVLTAGEVGAVTGCGQPCR